MLSDDQLRKYKQNGHLTVPAVFDQHMIGVALADLEAWSRDFLARLSDDEREWYLERGDATGTLPRKMDQPVYHRPAFQQMAASSPLVAMVEQLIGPGVTVVFSQVFCKPPRVGGPKPVHQDNFYFGPDDPESAVTAWIALDDATVENGCLCYAGGSHRGPILPHVAPPEEPFNLQIPMEKLQGVAMTPALVSSGGVSFHHGTTWHQSASNTSSRPRRAAAFHYLQNEASLVEPALEYDMSMAVKITPDGQS